MHVTLRQLRIFEAVARHSSISRAAEEMHLTQPAVSMQMKQLEEQIGLPLVEQIGKRMFLTEAGQELRNHAQRIGIQTEELKAAMDQFRGLERGLLRLSVVSTANYFLPRLIASYSDSHAGVRISLQVANRKEVLAALADNRTDLAVTGQVPDRGDLVAERFMDNPLVIIAPPAHALARRGTVPFRELDQAVLVVREPGSGTRAAMERHFSEHGITFRPGCELGTNEAIKQAVQAGLGLGVVPVQAVELELETGRLVVLPVEGFPLIRHWFIVRRSDKPLSAATQAFRTMLLAHSPKPPAMPAVAQRKPAARKGRPRRA